MSDQPIEDHFTTRVGIINLKQTMVLIPCHDFGS